MKPTISIEHDVDCPLGTNGLRAYHEARDAFSSMPPECRQSQKDLEDLAIAVFELEARQVCKCDVESAERFWKNAGFPIKVKP